MSTSTAVLLLIITGCGEITEYDLLYTSELRVFSGVSLELVETIETDADSRCLLVMNKRIYLGCTDGFVRCYNEDTHTLLEEVQVGLPSITGYSDMEYSPAEESIYLIGAMGSILELAATDCEVLDEFSVSPFPSLLRMSTGDPGFLWVTDTSLNDVFQIHPLTNGTCNTLGIPSCFQLSTLEPSAREDSLLVGTSGGYYRLEVTSSGALRSTLVANFPWSCLALSRNPIDSNFVTAVNMNQHTLVGEMRVYSDSSGVLPASVFFHSVEIAGDIFLMETADRDDRVYILSSHGTGESCLSSYRPGEEFGLEAQVDIPGNPLDLSVSEGGEVYVLTYR